MKNGFKICLPPPSQPVLSEQEAKNEEEQIIMFDKESLNYIEAEIYGSYLVAKDSHAVFDLYLTQVFK